MAEPDLDELFVSFRQLQQVETAAREIQVGARTALVVAAIASWPIGAARWGWLIAVWSVGCILEAASRVLFKHAEARRAMGALSGVLPVKKA